MTLLKSILLIEFLFFLPISYSMAYECDDYCQVEVELTNNSQPQVAVSILQNGITPPVPVFSKKIGRVNEEDSFHFRPLGETTIFTVNMESSKGSESPGFTASNTLVCKTPLNSRDKSSHLITNCDWTNAKMLLPGNITLVFTENVNTEDVALGIGVF